MILIATTTVGAGGGTISFTSIPQTFTDLVLKISARTTESAVGSSLLLGFNADSGANFNNRDLYGNGTTAGSTNTANSAYYVIGPWGDGSTATANTFANSEIYIPNYTGSTAKSFSMDSVVENNAAECRLFIQAGLWTGTAAINRIDIYRSLVQYSTASLYGIQKDNGYATVA